MKSDNEVCLENEPLLVDETEEGKTDKKGDNTIKATESLIQYEGQEKMSGAKTKN